MHQIDIAPHDMPFTIIRMTDSSGETRVSRYNGLSTQQGVDLAYEHSQLGFQTELFYPRGR